jgi:hypothetical protein
MVGLVGWTGDVGLLLVAKQLAMELIILYSREVLRSDGCTKTHDNMQLRRVAVHCCLVLCVLRARHGPVCHASGRLGVGSRSPVLYLDDLLLPAS